MRPQLRKGRCEASKEEEMRQSRLLPRRGPPRRQTAIVTREGLEKAASVHGAFCLSDDKGRFHAPRLSLSPPLTLNLCPPSCPPLFAHSVMPNLPFLSSRFSLFFFLATPPQRPCLQPPALSTPSAFLSVLSMDLLKHLYHPLVVGCSEAINRCPLLLGRTQARVSQKRCFFQVRFFCFCLHPASANLAHGQGG